MKKGFLTLLITACLIMLPSFPANAARLSDKLPLPAVMSLPSALQLSQTASASDNTSMEETYNIWVSNIQITEKNKNNVLSSPDASVIYTPALGSPGSNHYTPQKLTITDGTIHSILATEDLIIEFKGTSAVSSTERFPAVATTGSLVIVGDGTVHIHSPFSEDTLPDTYEAMVAIYGSSVEIKDISLTISAVKANCISSFDETGKIRLENVKLSANGNDSSYPAFTATNSIEIINSDVTIDGPALHTLGGTLSILDSSLTVDSKTEFGLYAEGDLLVSGNSTINLLSSGSQWPSVIGNEKISFSGESKVNIQSESDGILHYGGNFMEISEESQILITSGNYGIESHGDLIINGGSILSKAFEDGIHGQNIILKGGQLASTGDTAYGIYASYMSIQEGKADVTGANAGLYIVGETDRDSLIIDGGQLFASSSNQYGIRVLNGGICIKNGFLTSTGKTYGIHTGHDYDLKISGGMVESYGSEYSSFNHLFDISTYPDAIIFQGRIKETAAVVPAFDISHPYTRIEKGIVTAFPEKIRVEGIINAVYNGSGIKQQIKVYDGNTLLKENVDYTLSYKNNKNSYTYKEEDRQEFEKRKLKDKKLTAYQSFDSKKAPQVILKMKGNYSGKKSIYFQIFPLDIGNSNDKSAIDSFIASIPAKIENGKNLTPKPIVIWNRTNKSLKSGKDYDVYSVYSASDPSSNILSKEDLSYKKSGDYPLTIVGKGNFTGIRTITYKISPQQLTTAAGTSQVILMSDTKISSILPQDFFQWTDKTSDGLVSITPALSISCKKEPDHQLKETDDYTVDFFNNHKAGTCTAIIQGTGFDFDNDGVLYVGSILKTFKITGKDMRNITIHNLVNSGYYYTGIEIRPTELSSNPLSLELPADKNNPAGMPLIENVHYTVSYSQNIDKGTASILFTGIPEAGFTGVKKQTFKILPLPVNQCNITISSGISSNDQSVLYTAGATTPSVSVNRINSQGETILLKEGIDYTVSYKNNKKLYTAADNSHPAKAPVVIIKGKGNFSHNASVIFNISPKPLNHDDISVTAMDKIVNNSVTGWKQSFQLIDKNKKALSSKDYDKAGARYFLIQENGVLLDEPLDLTANPKAVGADSVIEIRVKPGFSGNYTGNDDEYAVGQYRIIEKGFHINSAVVKINPQEYTGKALQIRDPGQFVPDQIFIRQKGVKTALEFKKDFVIVENSYRKNISKGTAKVTIRGIGRYGGVKTISFKIIQRSVEKHWYDPLL